MSPDGRFVATRQGGRVKLWEVATGREAGTLTGDLTGWPGWGFVFSPDGRWLAAGREGVLKLWELPAGSEAAVVTLSADPKFRTRPTFSPDGKWLAFRAEGPDEASQVRIWDLEQVRERATLAGPAATLRFSPDGKTLAFESSEAESDGPPVGRIRLWDAVSGREKPWFEKQPVPLRRLAFSPDSRFLATGDRKRKDGHHQVKLWDLTSGKSRGPWTLPWGVVSLTFTADGSRLVATTFSDAFQVALIDPAAPPTEVTPIPLARSLSLSLSADGLLLARSPNQPDEAATIMALPECREQTALKPRRAGERLFLQDFTRDNKLLAVLAGWTDTPPPRRFRLFGSKTAAAPAPDKPELSQLEGELHLYETATGRWQGTVPVVRSARAWFTPDGKTLAVLAPEGTPTIWDLPLRTPWGRILLWWGVLAGCFAVAGLWLRGRRVGNQPSGVREQLNA